MEIERKWIVKTVHEDFVGLTPVEYVRDIIFVDENCELRIQKRDNKYELERKLIVDRLSRDSTKFEISIAEYEQLLKLSLGRLERIAYNKDGISIKEYKGRFEGLIRVEVEFKSEEEANAYIVPEWFGNEITGTNLANDSKLIKMSEDEFKTELNKLK